jgi:hypothetical protein
MTSIEWFFNELQRMQYFIGNDMLQAYKQAKEMHKQEIIDAVSYGNKNELMASQEMFAEQYYQETFKKD